MIARFAPSVRRVSFVSRWTAAALLAVSSLSVARPVSAQLIDRNYQTGATLAPAGDDTGVNLAYNSTFYGKAYSSIFVSTNGYLLFGDAVGIDDSSPFPQPGLAMAAPLWDDWTTEPTESPNSSVYYKIGSDRLEATWTVQHTGVNLPNTNPFVQFQAVVYNDGLIGYGYEDIRGGQNTIRGVNKGDGIASTDGGVFNEARSNTQRFYRFDSNTGRYNVVPAPVPEPGLLAAFAFGSLSFGLVIIRRKVG